MVNSPTLSKNYAGDPKNKRLAARIEPFDSYWQAPDDVASGYDKFATYYRANFFPYLPDNKAASILVISCGPGYFVKALIDAGYRTVFGIDSDPEKVSFAIERGLPCAAAEAFPFLADKDEVYDVIIAEQELNHLTLDESKEFLQLCCQALRPGGRVIVYAINSANPFVGSENRAQNIDHFYTVTEYSLDQIMRLGGLVDIKPFALQLYVFKGNILNYVGLALTSGLEAMLRIIFKLYGKKVDILSKKIGAVGYRP